MNKKQEKVLDAVKKDDIISLAGMKVDAEWAKGWSDENGRGLLHHAVHNRSSMAIQWMVDHWSMDPDVRDNQGETPLMRAAWLGNLHGMETLIEAGADLNIQARTGGTALHYAHGGDHAAAIKLLANTDPAIRDAEGRKPEEWKAQAIAIKQGELALKKIQSEPRRGVLRLGPKS